ncbi:conserved hypothetical protein [Methylobacterium sp. 4-46]|uniref:DUF2628 domain-containing protein n=1 Tax=unclassified Methylobacterium TaxID=2615210 RepID=UPI000152E7FD|nr:MULTISPECIES: DUF2628 domain-containing protein [Methylobacterium]ACA21038.1 conserved hypothetical protein [Methylobacterium sp. 4-46]WFT80188.1 DUF2628 domain-containing protein [Methylobacterium nodulans]
MSTYTLHLPDEVDPGAPDALDRAKLVPDRFIWSAFAFTALWFFWHRLWLAGLLVLVAEVAVWGAGLALNLSPPAGFLVTLLLSVLIGYEAPSLRRWTYERRGSPARDAVTAADSTEAEVKLVGRWLTRHAAPAAAVPPRVPPFAKTGSPALGLFPEADARR